MRLWLQTSVLVLALLSVAGSAVWLVYDLHKFLAKATVTVENIDRAVIVTGVAMTSLEKGALTWQKASADQTRAITTVMSNASAAVARFSSFTSNLDKSVNGQLLPGISKEITAQSASLSLTQQVAREQLESLNPVMKNLSDASLTLSTTLSDPDIKNSLADTAKSTQNLAVATDNFAATTAKVKQGVDYEVDELMKPVRKAKVFLLFIITAAGHFFGYA